MTLQKLHAKMIDAEDKIVATVDVDDLSRKPGSEYVRREIVLRGKRFKEPAGDTLDIAKADEWREVVA